MTRPRRPAKRSKAASKIMTGLEEALEHAKAQPRVLVESRTEIGPVHDYEYRWVVYPDDPVAREQLSDQHWDPVPYVDFGGALPSKDGFVHFQGHTLLRRRALQLTTASPSPSRFLVISLTITEK